ncbi:LYR motif-containing protein 5-like protein [Spinellus fusiger]|nr:LYR motif-containing protein 5-like protein [Spinellus fusiger]
MSTTSLRPQVIALYKQLVYLGREYPAGYHDFFRPKLKSAFLKKKDLVSEQEINRAIEHGHYIIKELEAMYYLRKYRALRQRYLNELQ